MDKLVLLSFLLLLPSAIASDVATAVTVSIGTSDTKLIGYIARQNVASNYSMHRLNPLVGASDP